MKKIVSLLLAFALLLSAVSLFSVPVSAATSGRRDSYTYCYVKISDSLLSKSGTQYATVKIKTYDGWPSLWNTGAYVTVTLRDGDTGAYICSFVTKGGDKINLGDDHRSYRIYIGAYDGGSNSFSNLGHSVKWKVTNPKDCTIS